MVRGAGWEWERVCGRVYELDGLSAGEQCGKNIDPGVMRNFAKADVHLPERICIQAERGRKQLDFLEFNRRERSDGSTRPADQSIVRGTGGIGIHELAGYRSRADNIAEDVCGDEVRAE